MSACKYDIPVEYENHGETLDLRTHRIQAVYDLQMTNLMMFLPVILLLGPNYRIGNLKDGQCRINTITAIPKHHVEAFVKPLVFAIFQFGSDVKTYREVCNRNVQSFVENLGAKAKKLGVYSWEYLLPKLTRGSPDYLEFNDFVEETQGVPYEVFRVMRYVYKDFPLPEKDTKWYVTEAQKLQCRESILYKPYGAPNRALPELHRTGN